MFTPWGGFKLILVTYLSTDLKRLGGLVMQRSGSVNIEVSRFSSIDGVLGAEDTRVHRKTRSEVVFSTPVKESASQHATPPSTFSVLFSAEKKSQESPVSRHSPNDLFQMKNKLNKLAFKFSLDIGADGKAAIVNGGNSSAPASVKKEDQDTKAEDKVPEKEEESEDSAATKTRILSILKQMRNNNKKRRTNDASPKRITKASQIVSSVSSSPSKKLILPPTTQLVRDKVTSNSGSKLPTLLVTETQSPSTPKPAPLLPNDCNVTPGYNMIDQALLSRPGSKFASPNGLSFSPRNRLLPRMSISGEKKFSKGFSPRGLTDTTNGNSLDSFLMGNDLENNWSDLYFNQAQTNGASRRNSVQFSVNGASSPNWFKYDSANITLSPLRNLENIQNQNTNGNNNPTSIISSPVFIRHDDTTDENQIMRINQHEKEHYKQQNQSFLQKLTSSYSQPNGVTNQITMSHIYRTLHNNSKAPNSAGIAAGHDNLEDDASSALKTLIK